ncbi:hypothetical protein GCM10020227_67940 [Streptomyces flavovirens]
MAETGLGHRRGGARLIAAAAGCGSATVRPSAKPETERTTTGTSVSTWTLQLARCASPKPAAAVSFTGYARGIRSARSPRCWVVNRASRALIASASASVKTRPTVVTLLRVASV